MTTKKALIKALQLGLIDMETFVAARRSTFDEIVDLLECVGFIHTLAFRNGLYRPVWEVV